MGKNEPQTAAPQPAPGCPALNWAAELERHHAWLRSVVVARVWEKEAVEEVLQDIALAAVSSRRPPRSAEQVGAWLYKIAVRQALLYRRRQGRQRKLMESYAVRRGADGFEETDPLDWLLNVERQELVRRAIECLHRRDRWIGVGVAPVPDLLRAHVSLPDAAGILVEQVVPDSPAAKAGLQRHDILTEADGKLLTDGTSLVDAVRAAQGGSLELKWIRGGRQMTAKVTPAERPKTLELGREQRGPGGVTVNPQDLGRLRDWIDRLEKNRGGQGPMSLRFFGPDDGQVFQNNINVQIERQGDEPAKIKVEKDGNSWELTEKDLDQLPPDVRTHVQSMLGGKMQFNLPNLQGVFPQSTPQLEQLFPDGFSFPEFETQLEEMNQRMERMFEELHQLRTEQQPAPVPVPAPEDLEGGDEA